MKGGKTILATLAARRPVAARVLILVAHPDDETIGMGAQLCRLNDALLVHVTDGAPRDGEDARRYGFADAGDYAAARRQELAAALRAGAADHIRTLGLATTDKEAMCDLAGLTQRIADLLRSEQPEAVFTHAYEGGHPDHDAAAFAVHCACRPIDNPPAILEMPLYHRSAGQLVAGSFLPWSTRPSPGRQSVELTIPLTIDEIARKRRMIDRFTTQRWLLEQFDLSTERFRLAPDYDFRQPPHPGPLHYETLGWGITGAEWRRAAAEALDRLGFGPGSCR